jgi:CRP/FNR family transcriptional regulator, cyclic AMP receptor protein
LKSSISSTWSHLPEFSELLAGAAPRRLRAGQVLFRIGDRGDGCYRLDLGVLKIAMVSQHARERIIALIGSGDFVGDLAMIDGRPRSALVTALTDCELRFVKRAKFEQITKKYPEIYRHLVGVLAARLRESDDTIASLAFMTMKARVARALLELAECFRASALIPRSVSQGDIAAMAGIARENASRILSDFERRGLLTKTVDSYQIDRTKLEREIRS